MCGLCGFYALNLVLKMVTKDDSQTNSGIRVANFRDEPMDMNFGEEGEF